MHIYIMRHGETYWNKQGRIQGSSDIELTDFGVSLAQQSADGFFRDGICFDRIYTSPYIRAVKTAEIIAKKNLKKNAPAQAFRVDARLREMCFGKYEGMSLADIKDGDPNILNCFSKPSLFVPDETGESYQDVFDRVDDFMEQELLALESEQQMDNVLVLCHGTVIRAFLARINQTPLDDFWKMRQPNCSINLVNLENGVFTSVREQILYYESEEMLHRGIL